MKGRKPDIKAIRRGQSDSYGEIVESSTGVVIPSDIESDSLRRQIWQAVCPEINSFIAADVPMLRELVFWTAIYEMANKDVEEKGLYDPTSEKLRKNPAIQIMKDATSEIRAISDQLGLSPLARSRIGLTQTMAVKTAAETAAMFTNATETRKALDAIYAEFETVD